MTGDLAYLNSLRDKNLAKEGLLVAEGKEVCLRLFKSGLAVRDVVCTPRIHDELAGQLPPGCVVHPMSEPAISAVVGFKFHRGILAIAQAPAIPSLTDALDGCQHGGKTTGQDPTHRPCRLLACPHISDPENLGSLYRSASALGWDGIIVGPGTVSPWSRRVVRVSTGSVFMLKTWRVDSPADLMRLKEKGCLIAGTSIMPGCESIADFAGNLKRLETIEDRGQSLALLFGHEFRGIPDDWLAVCDRLVHIPMSEGPDSLNVAVTAAICCYLLGRTS